MPAGILGLPNELVLRLLAFVTARQAVVLASTCRRLHRIIDSDLLLGLLARDLHRRDRHALSLERLTEMVKSE
jgi:hypothetical protein